MLTWFANRRRPDVIDDAWMGWRLFGPFSIAVLFHSDDDNRPVDSTQAFVVLKGRARLNGAWIEPGSVRLTRKGRPQRIALQESRTYEEALFDLNGWMAGNEIIHDSERRLWLLVVTP